MKISFIIPAYNVENFIAKCLSSILRQPFDDFELIVIDDGSTDRTAQILQDFQRLDARVKVFTQANSGQGAARNFGLTVAKGEYIWFVDSDDWLLPSVLPRLGKILDAQEPDVLVVNFEFSYDAQPAMPSSFVPSRLAGSMVEPRADIETFTSVSCWQAPPWRLISRRAHLLENNISFAPGVFYEDHPFAVHLMLTARKVFIDAPVVYAYYQRAFSTTKVNDRKAFDFLTVRRQVLDLFKRFDAYEQLAPIAAIYLAPANFYAAHVAEPFQAEFLKRLGEDLSESELGFIAEHADASGKLLIKAVHTGDPGMIQRSHHIARLRSKYSRTGARNFAARLRNAVLRRLGALAWRLRELLVKQRHHSGIDTTGRRFLQTGIGVSVDSIYIDVRLNQDLRPYVLAGDYSQIGGTFVFERGIGEITIGEKCSIGGGSKFICSQKEGIHLGNNVMLSWGCTLMDSDAHSLNPEVRFNDAYDWKCGVDAGRIGAFKDWSQVASAPIRIEDNAWLGFEVAVMKGVTIGRGAVIGSRSVVTRDIPPYCIYGGCPAKFIAFVPRDRWGWEEIIDAAQGNPEMQNLLQDAYLHRDLGRSLERYRSSDEFREILLELRTHAPNAKRLLDVGGGNGVMSIAFALEGFEVTLVEPSTGGITGVAGARRLLNFAAATIDSTLPQRVAILEQALEAFESEQKFDIIHCRQVVHHLKDPAVGVKKFYSLLKPGGIALLLREHVIFDEADLQLFLQSHPFQGYSGGEFGYRQDEYSGFLTGAGFESLREYKFADSPINYFPHSREVALSIDERQIAGRPYSFIARRN